ncbi:hypothetical protein QFZ77_003656 [Paenibacillus sp. V4I3]|uniref:hypothetical protein n=1 Tax=Paenibacillus sp. V4I3 TaxID=3042305 RepID=UPI00277D90F2|nr:hypothetical protein [Paenibacillus sp. V4I3]MDQ0874997.1 hypothetical protein [Paenibacillus sp. V4I3]
MNQNGILAFSIYFPKAERQIDINLGDYLLVHKTRSHMICRVNYANKQARKIGLSGTLRTNEWRTIFFDIFDSMCPLTNNRFPEHVLSLGHAVPLNWAQKGSNYGNVFPIWNKLNESMKDSSILRDLSIHDVTRENHNKLITTLASNNNLTEEQYREFYTACYNVRKQQRFLGNMKGKYKTDRNKRFSENLNDKLMITKRCIDQLGISKLHDSIKNHFSHKWGQSTELDIALNSNALKNGGVVRSIFRSNNKTEFFIATDLERKVTLVMHVADV